MKDKGLDVSVLVNKSVELSSTEALRLAEHTPIYVEAEESFLTEASRLMAAASLELEGISPLVVVSGGDTLVGLMIDNARFTPETAANWVAERMKGTKAAKDTKDTKDHYGALAEHPTIQ